MTRDELLHDLKQSDALLTGHFILSSGLHSAQYIQCAKLLQYPDKASKVAKAIAQHFEGKGITCVVGPALGGIIIAYAVAEVLGIRAIFGERQNGQMCLRRGFSISPDEKILAVEDVITTGKSIKELISVLESYKANIVGVASIIDRSSGENDFNCEFFNLMAIDIETYTDDQCPETLKSIPVTKPGSRGLK